MKKSKIKKIKCRRKENLNLLRLQVIMQDKWVGDINYAK